jgi:hypothetical protein
MFRSEYVPLTIVPVKGTTSCNKVFVTATSAEVRVLNEFDIIL